jgi:type II secretory pathway pseudopilin PulG
MLISPHLRRRRAPHTRQAGYMLLTVLLFVTLLVLASAAVAPRMKMQIERDREEEMIHRGVQYSRAIKRFYKKFGRYPNSLQELENTNNLRFLRRRYKDPVTGKEFKLLHMGEVKLFAQGVAGLPIAGAANAPGAPGGLNAQVTLGGVNQMTPFGQNAAGMATAAASQPGGTSGIPAGDQAGMTAGAVPGAQPGPAHNSGEQPQVEAQSDASPPQQQVFGGGAILGVASTSPKKTIREFNRKNHYKDWQFVYDPGTDRGGMLTGPAQPPLAGTSAAGPAVPGQQPFGQPQGTAPGQQPMQQNPFPQRTLPPSPFPQQPPDLQQQ